MKLSAKMVAKLEKPGWQTSEFWIALGINVVPLLAVLGVIGQEEVAGITENWQVAITQITGASAAVMYIIGRIILKKEVAKNAS